MLTHNQISRPSVPVSTFSASQSNRAHFSQVTLLQLILYINILEGWTITKGITSVFIFLTSSSNKTRNFAQFYSTKSERDKNLRKEYETQMEYRKHLQAFIDRWRYNANRGWPNMSQRFISFLIYFLKSCSSAIEDKDSGKSSL